MNCTGSCVHVGTRDAISELGLAVQHPEPAVADVLIPLTALHINPGSQWSKSIWNPFWGLHLSGQTGILGRNILSSLLQQVLLPLNQHSLPLIGWLGKATSPGLKIFCFIRFCFHFIKFHHFFQSGVQFKWHSLSLKEKEIKHTSLQKLGFFASKQEATKNCCFLRHWKKPESHLLHPIPSGSFEKPSQKPEQSYFKPCSNILYPITLYLLCHVWK